MHKIVLKGGEGEIIEKKSRFIATVAPVSDEQEACAFIETVKKKYWDARHNCSAFVIGEKAQLTRCSDDGEPSGTAGRPMLEVLLGSEIRNVAVVVTRYFGGTLLGTGGLVRAYTQAVQAGLASCEIGTMRMGVTLRIDTDYNSIGKVLYVLNEHGIEQQDSSYTDRVSLTVQMPAEESEELQKALTEATCGKVEMESLGEAFYVDKTS